MKREAWFKDWIENRKEFGLKAIQDFHLHGGEKDNWNGFVMNRMNLVQTVSVTNIIKKEGRMEMVYNDLIRKNILKEYIFRKKEVESSL